MTREVFILTILPNGKWFAENVPPHDERGYAKVYDFRGKTRYIAFLIRKGEIIPDRNTALEIGAKIALNRGVLVRVLDCGIC